MTGNYATERLPADAEGIARAADILRSGGIVAVPTETVYGLAARADSAEAVGRIYAAKGRPDFNPLIVHVAGLAAARELGEFDETAERLAAAHWPGPLTLVLPRRPHAGLAEAVTAGLATVAIRIPAHRAMQELLVATACPLAAPSANRSGFISPTTAQHVLASLGGRINAVLDAGPCEAGVESTIVAVRAGGALAVLRPGPLELGDVSQGPGIEAPGQLASHYAPGKPMRLQATKVAPDEFWIGFGSVGGDCTLSATANLVEAASRLYACLHRAAASQKHKIAVAPIPELGIGIAINDRLRRAATPPG